MNTNTFVMAESDLPNSLDPLQADYSNNLHASQMVHRTILEVGNDNTLQSSVLSDFGYNSNTHEIYFTVRPDAKFSDGSAISTNDVAMTIKRMALKRPNFPVLKHIVGVAPWSKKGDALSAELPGLRIDGTTLRIYLDHNIENPLFRFALPLFGVVKAGCVDLAANSLKTDCVTSGNYSLGTTVGDTLTFKRNSTAPERLPEEVRIRYLPRAISSADLAQMQDGNFVILVQDYALESSRQGQGFARIEQPNSRFSIFLLNPRSDIFANVDCRRYFAHVVRSHFAASSPLVQKESSIFSRLIPGSMSAEELEQAAPLSSSVVAQCKRTLAGKTVRWLPSPNNSNATFQQVLEGAVAELGMKKEVLSPAAGGGADRFDRFVAGEYDVLLGGSGFWAFDPVGDLQMLFTIGLHKPLSFVANDSRLQKMLTGLEFELDPGPRMKQINQYLYSQGLFNVFSHSKRVYLVKGDGVSPSIPIAITPPAPWQVFNVAPK